MAEPDPPLSEADQTSGAFIFGLSFQAANTDPDSDSRDITIGDPGTTTIDDFTIRPIPGFISTVTVSEEFAEARLVATPFPDDLTEDPEVISLSLLPGANYTVDTANASAELTIIESFPMTTQTVTVSIENLSPENGAFLTPLWFGFHDGTFDTYDRGRPVSPGLESLAEDGATDLISQEFDLAGFGTVQGTILGGEGIPGPIDPGEIASFTVELDPGDPTSRFFNYASMVIPSNDFFIANGNERAHAIFDEAGNFIGADFIVLGSQVLDAGSEINDEIPANTAFFGQMAPNTGGDENGVVVLAEGFIPGGPILSDPMFANADFTAPDFQVARIRVFLDNLVEEPAPPPTAFVVRRFQVNRAGIELLNNKDSLRLLGRIETLASTPGVLTEAQDNRIRIARGGAIVSETTAIQVNGVNTTINNLGLIDGGFNGINLANDDTASATIRNRGTIISDSRAVNIGGVGGSLVNYGQILSSASPRNGTIYGDVTALNIEIKNYGLIDVGHGLDGDAISLELGAQVEGQVVNYGLIQGRGLPLGNNQAAAVRLYWVPEAGPTSTFNGNIKNFGQLAAENGPAVIVEENTILNGDLINQGLISSPNSANGIGVRIEGEVTGKIINRGEINGGRDGIDIANGGRAIATILNTGLITSTSRAVNLGGADNRLINTGLITTTANPRNGTVYGDITALNIEIENRGLIDVGSGNSGDAISLELGELVTGNILNTGHIQGRGEVLGNNQAAAIRLFQPGGDGAPVAVFQGDIDNQGLLAAEQEAAIVIQTGTQLAGTIFNSGLIEGGQSHTAPSGYLAIDGREALGNLTVINTGTIVGDVLLSDGDDLFIGTGGIVYGVVQGNGGNDVLIGGAGDDRLYGGDGDDILEGGLGSDVKTGGSGADTFRFGADLIASSGGDMDVITDFEAIDRIDFSGFLGAGGQFSLAVLSDRLIANLSTGDTVTVLGDLTAAADQLTPLALG